MAVLSPAMLQVGNPRQALWTVFTAFGFILVFSLLRLDRRASRTVVWQPGGDTPSTNQTDGGVLGPPLVGDARCAHFKDPGNILISVKTGAAESYEKLVPQLLTTLRCPQRYELFSDLREVIGTSIVHDALENFDPYMKAHHKDFEIYRSQQQYQQNGQDIASLKGDGKAGWTLDKYKFMHLTQKVWNKHPNLKWYIFIESDTYLVWSNLIMWLERMERYSSELLYLGALNFINGGSFAHGGTGYIFSGKLLEKLVGQDDQFASSFDSALANECCGDYFLARVLQNNLSVEVTNVYPWMNGQTPSGVPYGPSSWCQPVITMHHITPRQRSSIYEFELKRTDQKRPLLFEELAELTLPTGNLPEEKTDWDNLADEEVPSSPEQPHTQETCRAQCLDTRDCFQYKYHDGKCYVSRQAFMLGNWKEPENGHPWVSGWNTKKIETWRAENRCIRPKWPKNP